MNKVRERLRACLWAALFMGAPAFAHVAVAEETHKPSFAKTDDGRYRIRSHPKIGSGPAETSNSSRSTGGWWLGTAGVALVFAAIGGLSVAAKRFLPKIESSPLRVIGRTSLSPRHTVYLLKAGDRILLVGAGPQGAPTLLGELEPDEVEIPRPAVERKAPASPSIPLIARFRVGSGT